MLKSMMNDFNHNSESFLLLKLKMVVFPFGTVFVGRFVIELDNENT